MPVKLGFIILSLIGVLRIPEEFYLTKTKKERNDLIGWIAFKVCNAKTYELFMSTNVYKRFDPRVMERKERIGINRGLPTFSYLILNCKQFTKLYILLTMMVI